MNQYCPYHRDSRRPTLCPDCLRSMRKIQAPFPQRTSIPRSLEDQGQLRLHVLSGADGRLDRIMFVQTKPEGEQS